MTNKSTNKLTIKKAFLSTIPVLTGYMVLGIAFGILLSTKGYSFYLAPLMSLVIFAGSMQFVAINLISSAAGIASTVIVTLLVNARHLIYGISMLEKYKGTGKIKPYLIFSLTDETYALLCNELPPGVNKKLYYFCVSVFNQLYWITASLIGGIIGSSLTFNTAGIDFAMTALFVVIFTEQWLTNKDKTPGLIGIISTLLCLIIFKSDNFLIPSMVLILLLLSLRETLKEKRALNE